MKNKKAQVAWVIVIAALIIIGFIIFFSLNNNMATGSAIVEQVTQDQVGVDDSSGQNTYNIEITSSGFSPSQLSINQGDSVTWINKDSEPHWPASGMHPTHTRYSGASYDEPGSFAGSLACKSEGNPKDGAFDPCKSIAPGESWTFTFEQIGSWGFHDHLDSSYFGKITVQ